MKLVGYQEKREKRWCEGEREKTVRQTERGGRRKKGKKDQMGRLCVCLYVSVRVRQRKSLRTLPPPIHPAFTKCSKVKSAQKRAVVAWPLFPPLKTQGCVWLPLTKDKRLLREFVPLVMELIDPHPAPPKLRFLPGHHTYSNGTGVCIHVAGRGTI